MYRLMSMVMLAVVGLSGLPSVGQAAEELTFTKVLRLGLERSLEAKRAALAVQLAADDRRVLSYENDPRLALSGNWSESRPRSQAPAADGAARNQVYVAQLNATLYDFGRHGTRMDRAGYAEQVQRLAETEVAESLRYAIARGYAAVLAAERIAQVATEQLAVDAAQLKEQRLNYQRGLRPESDVVMAEVTLGRADLALVRAQDASRAARIALGFLIGEGQQPLLVGAVPLTSLRLGDTVRWQQLLAAWQEFAKGAAQLRREQETKALSSDEELIAAVQRPLLQGSVAATRSGAWTGGQRQLYSGQVGLSWDLPWNGMARDEKRRIATRRQALSVQDEIDHKARSDLDAVAREQFRAAQNQLTALNTQVRLIAREHELVQRRYQAGKASALEVSATDADLLTQRLAVVTTLNALTLSVIDVAQARAVADLEGVFK